MSRAPAVLDRSIIALGSGLASCLAASLLFVAVAVGADPAPVSFPPLEFRRVHVAEQDMSELDLAGVHVPVKRVEFERLIRSAQVASTPAEDVRSRIAQAQYSARLDGQRLINGEAELTILHEDQRPAVLSLEPCNLVIEGTGWSPLELAEPAPVASQSASDAAAVPDAATPVPAPRAPATGAARAGFDNAGKLGVLLPGPGTLKLSWTLRGQSDGTGRLAFVLQLPACPLTRMLLDLPRGMQPVVSHGFAALAETAVDGPEWDRWLLQLAGHSPVALQIAPLQPGRQSARLVYVRQHAMYDFSPQGLELTVDLKTDVFHEPLSQFPLEMSPGLRLIEARVDGQPLTWTDTAQADGTQVVLEMPEPLLGMDRMLRVRAVAPLKLGQRGQLPVVLAPSAVWLHGTAALNVPASLTLEQLFTAGCEATGVSPLDEAGGESVRIQCFEPQAGIGATVQMRRGEVTVRSGTSINLGRSRTSAVQISELTATGPPRFELVLAVSPNWTVDLIDTQPAGLLDEWLQVGRVAGRRLIELRFREPLAAERPLRVVVHAHGRGLRGIYELPGDSLRLGEFRDSTTSRHLFALATEPPNQIRLAGSSQVASVSAGDLTEDEQQLVATPPGAVLFADGPEADEMTIALSSDPPNYSARIHLQAEASDRKLELVYRIAVRPQSSAVDRVLVRFSEACEPSLNWSLEDQPLVAKRQPVTKLPSDPGETWQITLNEQQDAPFELLARRVIELAGPVPLPLASLPGAAAQTGTVSVSSLDADPLQITPQNLRPIAAEPLPPGVYSSTRGAFRYDPLQDGGLTLQRPEDPLAGQQVWAWSEELESRHYADGRTLHQITYRIENSGAPAVTLNVGPTVEWIACRVEGRDVPVARNGASSKQLKVPLPRGVRFPTLQAEYVAAGPQLSVTGSLDAWWPKLDQPVFRRQWTAWLPPGVSPLPEARASSSWPWQQRLFGSLLRRPDRKPFRPLARADQAPGAASAATAGPDSRRAQSALRGLWSQYAALRESAEAGSPPRPLTWGELLAAWQSVVEPGGAELLWVDPQAVRLAGITTDSVVAAPRRTGQPTESAAALLDAAGLALLIDRSRLVLSTSADVGPGDDSVALAGLENVRASAASPAEPRDVQTTGGSQMLLRDWLDRPPLPQVCWQPLDRSSHEVLRQAGWTSYPLPVTRAELDGSMRLQSSVAVYQPLVFQALGWAVTLCVAGLAVWILRRRLLFAPPLAAIAGCSALLAPPLAAAISQSVFLGILCGGLLALLSRSRTSQAIGQAARDKRGSTTHTPSTASASAVTASLILMLWSASEAETAEASKPEQQPPVYQVISPIDAGGEAAGDYLFVPKDLYDGLLRTTSSQLGSAQKWMIYDASYRAVMNWNAAEEQLSVVELTATYQVELFASAGRLLSLPMTEDQVQLLPNGASVDGLPAPVGWSEAGGGLTVEIDSPGVHRLELAFRPLVRRGEAHDGFQMGIPPAPGSQLSVESSDEFAELEFPSALGSVRSDRQTGRKLVQLGPAPLLAVQWPTDPNAAAAPAALELDILTWLKISPDRVTLDARLRLSTLTAPIKAVDLAADPRLRLLPPEADQPIGWYESSQGPAQTIHLDFKPPHAEQLDLALSFLMDQTVGAGKILLPRLEGISSRTVRHWLAVSVDPNLQLEPLPADTSLPEAPAEFAAAWGGSEAAPQFVVDMDSPAASRQLSVRPLEPRAIASEHLELSCAIDSADVVYTAEIEMQQGSRMQYEIGLPPFPLTLPAAAGKPAPSGSRSALPFQVTSISVDEAGEQRLLAWAPSGPDAVVARLNKPVRGKHRLRIRGQLTFPLPLAAGTTLAVPAWNLAGVTTAGRHVDIYRAPGVQLSSIQHSGFTDAGDFQSGRYRPGRGRWAAALDQATDAQTPELRLVLSPNRPRITGNMVVVVRREGDKWAAEVHCRLGISGGVVDQLRFEIPADLKGPFQNDPEAELMLADVPGQGRQQLVVRPLQAAGGDWSLMLRASLAAMPRERARVPDVVLLDAAAVDAYLVIPSRIDQQTIEWERSGLRAQPLPREFQSLRGPSDVSYEMLRPRFQAAIKDVQFQSSAASVRLADHFLDVDADGRVVGVAAFDLEPAGRGDCQLLVPEGLRVLHVKVAELPVSAIPAGPQRLNVPLGSEQLAQHIEVLFETRLSPREGDAGVLLPAPEVEGLSVQNTCWTIRTGDGPLRVVSTAAVADPRELDRLRARSLAAQIAHADELLQDGDPDAVSGWYVPWARRWATVRARLALDEKRVPSGNTQELAQWALLDENQERILERLRLSASSVQQQAWWASEAGDVWRIAGSPASRLTTLIQHQASDRPRLVRVEQSAAKSRTAVVAAAIAVLAAAGLLSLLPSLRTMLQRHPQIQRLDPKILAAMGLGLLWWLYFAASFAGFLLFVASLLVLALQVVRSHLRRKAWRPL